jgi:hypothetical protein
MLQGVFCGDCLFMRYGENVKEANANSAWTCPDCRGMPLLCFTPYIHWAMIPAPVLCQ